MKSPASSLIPPPSSLGTAQAAVAEVCEKLGRDLESALNL